MKQFVLLCTLLTLLSAKTQIISHNIYQQDDFIDLMLSFDMPYDGKIVKKEESNSTLLMLEQITIDKKIHRDINNSIAQLIEIIPDQTQVFVKVTSKTPFELSASKTIDNTGLRIRLKSQALQTLDDFRTLQTKKEDDISQSFLKVVIVLLFLFALLYALKRWMLSPGKSSSWLFNMKQSDEIDDIKIVKQKVIDMKHKVVLIAYKEKRYLVLMGENSLLLDTYDADEENQFDHHLNENKTKLDSILKDITERNRH